MSIQLNTWHEPDTSQIRLTNGTTVEAEINGLDLDGTTGFAFVHGREVEVQTTGKVNQWEEIRK